jgi:hypothetical protein
MTTEVKTVTLEQLTTKMATAVAANDITAMLDVAGEIKKLKSEVAKAEATRLQKESEELAEVRKQAVEKLDKIVRVRDMQKLVSLAESVKAIGFHYTHTFADNLTTIGFDYAVAPKQKATRASGGGGGKSKAEFGMTLNEIFEKFATAEDKTKLTEASASATRPDSAEYAVKLGVKKAAIAAGLLKPVS